MTPPKADAPLEQIMLSSSPWMYTGRAAYNMQHAADVCGLSRDTIRRAIRAGRLPAKRVGRKVVVLDEDLREWLRGLEDF